ncbi:MAG: hypothetical protein ACP5OS_05190 [Leptospirillia bacterium]
MFRHSRILLPMALLALASCHLYASGKDDRQGDYLISARSEPNYVRTIPVPPSKESLVVVKKVRLESKVRMSPIDFIRESKPRPYHDYGKLYLRDFHRKKTYAEEEPQRPYRWIRPLGGRPYRYLYTGEFVAFPKDWAEEKAWEKRKAIKRERKIAHESARGRAVDLPHSKARGPLGGAVIQQDENSMTEMLPSGAYVFHPKSELEGAGYHFNPAAGWSLEK